ncbi:MAG: hypothetical protein QXT86_12115 [Archaeoglobaceae archaeon]
MNQERLLKETEQVIAESAVPSVVEVKTPTRVDELSEIIEQAEKLVELNKRLRNVILKITNSSDWVKMGDKLYLQASGAEKLMRDLGIQLVEIMERQIVEEPDGHFYVLYRGKFEWKGRQIIVEGLRSSRDPFFCRKGGREIPPDQINRSIVIKSAFSNMIARGVSILLGLRNLTEEDLRGVIDQRKVTKVEFEKNV